MESNANRRTVNFTESEENMLLLLIKKYATIIENKKTDSSINYKKNEAWAQIEREFNACSRGGTYRSMIVLKNKYTNIKKRSVKKFSNAKKMMYCTGGGPNIQFTDNEVDTTIREIIGSRMTGLTSEFDNDSQIEIEHEEYSPSTSTVSEGEELLNQEDLTVIYKSDEEVTETKLDKTVVEEKNWSKMSVENLRTPKAKELRGDNNTRKNNTLKSKLTDWAKSKEDLLSIQQKCIIDESRQKLQHNEEKHKQELRHREERHKQQLKMEKEEHRIKMDILELQKKTVVINYCE
ncbi:unnamed protein product [Diabrotica balteata]|uniref:Regulatory protein zeste n=1 Tax=Diabrotica balteata TaxID=107213 RepID=A0A9N9TFX0_DIABA|nr:unnamed protein product [Diabrotica balteata]